jgi:hypothetical protein
LAISARISWLPVAGLIRVSEKDPSPRGGVDPSDSLTVTSYALSFGSISFGGTARGRSLFSEM